MAIITFTKNENQTVPDSAYSTTDDIESYKDSDGYGRQVDNRPLARIHSNIVALDNALQGEGTAGAVLLNKGFRLTNGTDTWTIIPNFDTNSPSFKVYFSPVTDFDNPGEPDRVWDLASTSTTTVNF